MAADSDDDAGLMFEPFERGREFHQVALVLDNRRLRIWSHCLVLVRISEARFGTILAHQTPQTATFEREVPRLSSCFVTCRVVPGGVIVRLGVKWSQVQILPSRPTPTQLTRRHSHASNE